MARVVGEKYLTHTALAEAVEDAVSRSIRHEEAAGGQADHTVAGAGVKLVSRTACSDMTGATPEVSSRGRCNSGEVHFLQEGLEAGVGAERIERKPFVEEGQQSVAFLGGRLQPRDGLLQVAESKADLSHHKTREILPGPSPFQIVEDLEGLLPLPDEP